MRLRTPGLTTPNYHHDSLYPPPGYINQVSRPFSSVFLNLEQRTGTTPSSKLRRLLGLISNAGREAKPVSKNAFVLAVRPRRRAKAVNDSKAAIPTMLKYLRILRERSLYRLDCR
jgi:hypothetical protein